VVAPVPRSPAALREEARLYLTWTRGAAGRFAFAAPSPPAPPSPSPDASPPATEDAPAVHGDAIRAVDTAPDELDALRAQASVCRRCSLCDTRTTVVFGEGSRRPRLMVVGEAPGADEDRSGRPFVGRAGQLLTRMLAAIGLAREDVYIGNVLKCRPPENRPPRPDEVAACRPFLEEQMRLLSPALVLVLGNLAARAVLGTDAGISRIRGRVTTSPEGVRVLPTYHPAFLLRTPEAKREAWLDLQLAAETLGITIPARVPRADEP
jgi:DNA polymerase